jgi:putative endonuclease
LSTIKEATINTNIKGRLGEDRAALYMEENCMRILLRNYRTREGEIDIRAEDHGCMVFAEVKSYAKYGVGSLEYSICEKKRSKIINTAKYFLINHRQYSNMAVRFDVVYLAPDTVRYLAHAFTESV